MSDSQANGAYRRSQFLSDFQLVKEDVHKTREKIKYIETMVQRGDRYLSHLDKLPSIATTLRIQAVTNILLLGFLAIVVTIVLIKGTNMNLKIPGYFEINGGAKE